MEIKGKKIKSALVEGKEGLKDKYEDIYDRTFFTSFTGIHSTIIHFIEGDLKNKGVLDVGCGAGRLAIMCSQYAKHVDAFDFSEKAIKLARLIAESVGSNVNFFVSDANKLIEQKKTYDIITVSEVIEHVKDPLRLMKQLNQLLSEGGMLVISCPSFLNFRGDVYMVLLKLFELPMSLADLRQVTPKDMQDWSNKAGFKIEKTIGMLYDLGFEERACLDMKKRTPLAVRDKNLKGDLNYEEYNEWLKQRAETNKEFLSYLLRNDLLKKRKNDLKLIPKKIGGVNEALFNDIKEYLEDSDKTENVYYSDKEPFNTLGAGAIYILRKI